MNDIQPNSFTDYRLISGSHKSLHNMLKFQNSKPVEPSHFTNPVKLQRKERNLKRSQLLQELNTAKVTSETTISGSTSGADPTIIAPYGGASRNKQNIYKKRTKQVFPTDESSRKLKEQETNPWILEDYDGTNYWSGNLEGGQQSNYFLFVFSEDGFKVVPVHRWYRFQQKLSYATLTIEEAEEQLIKAQKKDSDRWMMRKRLANKIEGDETGEERCVPRRLKVVDHDDLQYADDDTISTNKKKRSIVSKHGDIEEVDFDEVFEDDEETLPELEAGQDEIKDRSRIKPNQTVASDDEEERDRNKEDELTATGKEMKKALLTLEKNAAYASDDDGNPYLSEEEVEGKGEEDKETGEDKKKYETIESLRVIKPGQIAKSELFNPKPIKPISKTAPAARLSGATNTDKKRKLEVITSDSIKKQRITSASIVKPSTVSDANLITENEIVDLIKNNRLTTKDLIAKIKKKLKANPRNKQLLSTIVKKVATTKDGFLELQ
ncbi:transcription factor IIF subunit tfg1 [Basidiobolus ranarum]|uniref:Transcription initiation factor IIF subunit alpha n=1 Tax=Basidiobolus ranarum TaxID=34480 RepID=A0ABR2VVU7_9FUNG